MLPVISTGASKIHAQEMNFLLPSFPDTEVFEKETIKQKLLYADSTSRRENKYNFLLTKSSAKPSSCAGEWDLKVIQTYQFKH